MDLSIYWLIFTSSTDDVITEHNIDNIPVIITQEKNVDADVICYINDLKDITKNIQTEIESLKEKQETSLSEIQATINIILAKINNDQYDKGDSVLQDNKIKKHLPLVSIGNFFEFENILKDEQKGFMQIVSKSVY